METQQNYEQNIELKKVHQLLAKNIDDFKYLVLCNMRLDENSKPSNEPLHLDINRISDFQEKKAENLEEWVKREFAPKSAKKERYAYMHDVPGETLEQWVARQKIQPKDTRTSVSIMDAIEQWLMNEAKKDLFAELDAKYGGPETLSSDYVRGLGMNLISLADKLDRMRSRTTSI